MKSLVTKMQEHWISWSYRFSHHLEMIHEIILLFFPTLGATLTDLASAYDESLQANEKKSNREPQE